jgi:hypothetical protein
MCFELECEHNSDPNRPNFAVAPSVLLFANEHIRRVAMAPNDYMAAFSLVRRLTFERNTIVSYPCLAISTGSTQYRIMFTFKPPTYQVGDL